MTVNGQVENRWPRPEKPDSSALLQGIAAVPSPTLPKINLPTLQRYGIDPEDLIRRIVRAEDASQNPSAKNASTSATGLGQFTEGTWLDVLKHYRRDLYDWFSPDPEDRKRLELRIDPALSRQMAGAYADQNAKTLANAQLPVTHGTIYLSHFLGPGNAMKILRGDPNSLARSVVPDGVPGNEGFILPNMTVRDLIERAEDVMQHGTGHWRPSH